MTPLELLGFGGTAQSMCCPTLLVPRSVFKTLYPVSDGGLLL